MKIRSLAEKRTFKILCRSVPQNKLPFPLREVKSEEFVTEYVYDIPDVKKREVLNQLWPFTNPPSIDDVLFDIHEQNYFKMRDYLVIRFDEYNMIVSPYFLKSGGTIFDFFKSENQQINMNVIL